MSDHLNVETGEVSTKAEEGKSAIVFMRPSNFGGAIQATVFDGTQYIGTSSASTKFVYQADPGEHMFMVIGESADFMQADLESGKTYYALIEARMGVWKARFSFRPISASVAKDYINFGKWVTINDKGRSWAKENEASIKQKYNDYLPKWQGKPESERQTQTLPKNYGE